jgi:hypothetical protein
VWSKIIGILGRFIAYLDGAPTRKQLEKKMSDKNEQNVRVFKDEITRPGRYTVTINGVMTPGEIYVNDDLRVSVYATAGDLTMVCYLLPGDEVMTKGGIAALHPVQYAV